MYVKTFKLTLLLSLVTS